MSMAQIMVIVSDREEMERQRDSPHLCDVRVCVSVSVCFNLHFLFGQTTCAKEHLRLLLIRTCLAINHSELVNEMNAQADQVSSKRGRAIN